MSDFYSLESDRASGHGRTS